MNDKKSVLIEVCLYMEEQRMRNVPRTKYFDLAHPPFISTSLIVRIGFLLGEFLDPSMFDHNWKQTRELCMKRYECGGYPIFSHL